MNEFLDIFRTFATPVAAVFAAYTAWKFGAVQAKVARNKLKLDLFDRRLVIYNAAITMIGQLSASGGLSSEDERNYLIGVNGAHWLFDSDIVELLEKTIWHQMADFSLLVSQLKDADEPADRKALSEKKMNARRALMAQREVLDRVLKPYLKLES